MERRHYIEIADAEIASITSITRVFTLDTVTAYRINDTTNYNIAETYDLLVNLPVDEPLKGQIAHSDVNETWTRDGIYLHNSGEAGEVGFTKVYIKDFLEDVPGSYQSKMINELTNLDTMAGYLVDNNIDPKEFDIIFINNDQHGIQDQIIAYVNNIYYVNSSNDYVPYGNTNTNYNANWAIPDTIYDPAAKASGLISNGFRSDMVLKSNKLIYLMKYEGMLLTDVEPYLQDVNSTLVYLNNVTIDSVHYQVYYNPMYIYDTSGDMINPLVPTLCQTITVEDGFLHNNLKGKVMKVW